MQPSLLFFSRRADTRHLPSFPTRRSSDLLQTVSAEGNPRYYALIRAVERRTGVPIVLNTSFNENEPIVLKPAEALDCFLRTDRKSTRLNSSHVEISYAVFCLKKKKKKQIT